jgi:glycosyltransferase involved in cell wall biosynthesis
MRPELTAAEGGGKPHSSTIILCNMSGGTPYADSEHPAPLRILLLAPQPFFEVRGTPLAVRALTRALGELGHSIDLLCYPRGEDVSLPHTRLLRSLRLPVGRVRPGFSLAKLILDVPFMIEAAARVLFGPYDVVHAVEEAAHLVAPVARLARLPLVMDVDSSLAEQLAAARVPLRRPVLALVRLLETHALRSAAATITICGSLSDNVRRVAPASAVFQIEDPPLVEAEAPASAEDIAGLRRALGLKDGPVVLYSGNFEPYQGVDLLVDAAAHVDDAQFVFMGGEANEIEALRARATARGVLPRCLFAGKRPPEELPLFLALADVLVSPRRRGQNTPFKIYTYLASGKPVVATRIDAHSQMLHDGIAWLVDVTPEALAAGIRRVLDDPLAAIERAVRGRAFAQREFGIDAFREKVRRAYAHVAGIVAERQRARR